MPCIPNNSAACRAFRSSHVGCSAGNESLHSKVTAGISKLTAKLGSLHNCGDQSVTKSDERPRDVYLIGVHQVVDVAGPLVGSTCIICSPVVTDMGPFDLCSTCQHLSTRAES